MDNELLMSDQNRRSSLVKAIREYIDAYELSDPDWWLFDDLYDREMGCAMVIGDDETEEVDTLCRLGIAGRADDDPYLILQTEDGWFLYKFLTWMNDERKQA
jgi:hypothetical protein